MARIMIVDDSSLARKLLKKVLLNLNHDIVAELDSGESSVLEYTRIKPDIVTMDLDMPGISGIEAANRIMKKYPDACIIIVSAREKNDLSAELTKNGLKYHVNKPVTDKNVSEVMDLVCMEMNTKSTPTSSPPTQIQSVETNESPREFLIGNIGVKQGTIVTIGHYSEINPIKSIVTEVENNNLTLKLTKEFTINSFFEGDPVVLGLVEKDECHICECTILLISPKNRILKIEVIESEYKKDGREFERFPSSLYIEIKENNLRKKSTAVVRNISMSGMTIESKEDFSQGDKIEFDIFISNSVLPLCAEVIWKDSKENGYLYGLKSIYDSYKTKTAVERYIQILKEDQERSIKDLLSHVQV